MNILFVCSANMCRSPTAEGIFSRLVQNTEGSVIDSAGTYCYQNGRTPDVLSIQTASNHNIDISNLKSRKIIEMDFGIFDKIIAMDNSNLESLTSICPKEFYSKLSLLLSYTEKYDFDEVPDPYRFSENGFEDVYQIISDGCSGLLNTL